MVVAVVVAVAAEVEAVVRLGQILLAHAKAVPGAGHSRAAVHNLVVAPNLAGVLNQEIALGHVNRGVLLLGQGQRRDRDLR